MPVEKALTPYYQRSVAEVVFPMALYRLKAMWAGKSRGEETSSYSYLLVDIDRLKQIETNFNSNESTSFALPYHRRLRSVVYIGETTRKAEVRLEEHAREKFGAKKVRSLGMLIVQRFKGAHSAKQAALSEFILAAFSDYMSLHSSWKPSRLNTSRKNQMYFTSYHVEAMSERLMNLFDPNVLHSHNPDFICARPRKYVCSDCRQAFILPRDLTKHQHTCHSPSVDLVDAFYAMLRRRGTDLDILGERSPLFVPFRSSSTPHLLSSENKQENTTATSECPSLPLIDVVDHVQERIEAIVEPSASQTVDEQQRSSQDAVAKKLENLTDKTDSPTPTFPLAESGRGIGTDEYGSMINMNLKRAFMFVACVLFGAGISYYWLTSKGNGQRQTADADEQEK